LLHDERAPARADYPQRVRASSRPVVAAILGSAAALAGAVGGVSPAASPQQQLQIAGDPALYPAFDPAVSDYASRCGASGSLKLTIDAPPGETVSVDGGPPQSGSFESTTQLKAGQGLVATASSAAGSASYHVRCLPADFPVWTAERTGPTQAQWYLITPHGHWLSFFDSHGVPVWWKRTKGLAFNATLTRGDHVAWYPLLPQTKFGVKASIVYEEHRLDGSVVRTLATVGVPTDLHEIQQLPNGHYLLDAYRPRHGVDLSPYGGPAKATVYDAEAQEVTPTGRLVWSWSSHGHIGLGETKRRWPTFIRTQRKFPPKYRAYDPVHINSISPDGKGFVISTRHTDAVYKIDKATGRIVWKLGGTHTQRSLTIKGDPDYGSTSFGGQHDARVLPDGTITIYDNGSERDRPPRVLRYRIDAKKRTATLLEHLTDPDVPRSTWGGGTRKMPGGNWATAWGGEPYVTEMTPEGKVVLRLYFPPDNDSYRVVPIPFGQISPAKLRAAMDHMHPRTP
jgi:hypothetical protein